MDFEQSGGYIAKSEKLVTLYKAMNLLPAVLFQIIIIVFTFLCVYVPMVINTQILRHPNTKYQMKKIIFMLLVLLTVAACKEESAISTDLYIYLDFTEGEDYSEHLEADIDKYIGLLDADGENSRNYGTIKVYPLHDVSAGMSKTVKLKEGKSSFEGNKFLRKKEVEEFKTKLLDKMVEVNSSYTGKELNNSYIFTPLCKGVKKLNKSDANRKVILVYSDMLENSDIANFHSKSMKYESLKASFDKACGIDDASDIEFYIVHPVDKKNDHKIQKAADLWTKYLIEKGVDEDAFHFDTSIDI